MDKDDDGRTSVVEIEARYVPVPITLEPRESVNSKTLTSATRSDPNFATDQGIVRVDLLYGRDIHAADRGGKCQAPLSLDTHLIPIFRQVRSIRRLPAQRPEGVQVSDEKEDCQSRLERRLCFPSGE